MAVLEITLTHYVVRVLQQGELIASHAVDAPDALNAINLVEQHYYQPARYEKAFIEDEEGRRHEVINAANWRGLMFEAHAAGHDHTGSAKAGAATERLRRPS